MDLFPSGNNFTLALPVTNIRYSSVHTFLQEGTVYDTAVFCSRLSCRSRDRLTQFAIFASHPIHPSTLSSSLSLSLSLSHHWLWDLRLPIYCIVYKIYFWQYKLTKRLMDVSQGSKWKDATHVKRHWVKKVAYCDAQFWARNQNQHFTFCPQQYLSPVHIQKIQARKGGFVVNVSLV